MGIQLATQTLDKIAASQHVLDMMRDIQDSCGVAIEILNDLLMFDKLESEGLRLEKQIVLLKPLVMKILNQFTIQVEYPSIIILLCFAGPASTRLISLRRHRSLFT